MEFENKTDVLKDNLSQAKDNLGHAKDNLADAAKCAGQALLNGLDKAKSSTKQLAVKSSDKAVDLYGASSDKVAHCVNKLNDKVSEKPLQSVVVAFGIGALLATLFIKKDKQHIDY